MSRYDPAGQFEADGKGGVRFAILGLGHIGQRIARHRLNAAAIMLRPERREAAQRLFPEIVIATCIEEVLDLRPEVVVEAASAGLLCEVADPVLQAGSSLIPLSLGAFVDEAFHRRVRESAAATGAGKLLIPAGAIGSLDAILAARESGLEWVTFRNVSPPHVFRTTIVAADFDLDGLSQPTLVWQGTAREAGRAFPRNCNVAVGVALAGIGLDRTRVELHADPAAERSSLNITFKAEASSGSIEMIGRPLSPGADFADLTAYSVLAMLRQWNGWIDF